ncbi:MAG: UDP-3-O-(3-hydroxymyristoyl)glucosamine N-acyltransferase [Chitinophagaceae bacterium]
MLFPSGTTAQWIATLTGAEVIGDGDAIIPGINEIHKVQPGDLVFVDHPKYYDKCLNSVARFVLINSKEVTVPQGKTLLYTTEPFEAYLSIVQHFRPFLSANQMISDTAVVGEGSVIMPGTFIGHHVVIGNNCIIYPNVSVYDYTSIGDNVIIHSGTTIGADAFYYNIKKNRDIWAKKMKSCGRVMIEDDVEIGANCCIDKGVTNNTVIGRGTKMDNLIQIGHDVEIGSNCIIASQVGIAGATVVGDGVTLWGQVGVNKTIRIGDNAVVLGQSGVTASLEANKTYMGYPAEDASIKRRELVWLKRIPALWKKVMQE